MRLGLGAGKGGGGIRTVGARDGARRRRARGPGVRRRRTVLTVVGMSISARSCLAAIAVSLGALVAMGCGDADEAPTGSTVTSTGTTTGSGGSSGTAGGGSTATGGTAGTGASGGEASGLAPDCSAPAGTAGGMKLTPVAEGLEQPVLVTAPPGDARLFVLEQTGRVVLIDGDSQSTFLDLTARLVSGGERGLLGLAFAPDYAQSGRFFVHYSEAGTGDTRIEEYARSADDPNLAAPDPVGEPLLEVEQPAGNHNGGSIAFDPVDGYLFVALGDGGGANDQYGNGQNTQTLLGALLRIDVSTLPYAIPAGNLSGGAPEIFDWGLRNPYRISFDPCTGDRYIGDVGQNLWEEIDVAAASTGPQNWGWNVMEGTHCFQSSSCDSSPYTPPAVEYAHDQGCSVTGGYVYRGSELPWLRGAYLYGDYCTGKIWSFRWDGSSATEQTDWSAELGSEGTLLVSSFGQDATGELYVVDYGGTVYRLEAE